jgi:hypothetical protein
MKTVCAYCNAVIHSSDNPDEHIGHGICRSCADYALATLGIDLVRYLDMFGAPVIIVDNDVTVLGSNYRAREFLGKLVIESGKYRGGEVFGCSNSRLAGGCGRPITCSGCTIRNPVMETWRTGEPFERRPAVINRESHHTGGGQVDLYIWTRKDGDVVLLKMEPVGAGVPAVM